MEDTKFKISVIIPIYDVEQYLEETIISVIHQTMDFRKNIQMILVNDGSPDNSEEICLKYQALYPDNVIYVKQENAGVSAARNNGLGYATGEYVNFLDSDDVWDLDVFQKVYQLFQKNPSIDLVGVRQKYFEASTNYVSLDFKFDGDRVVDITKEYQWIQLSVTSGFFKKSAIKDIRFDTRIKYSEDAKFIYEVLIANRDTSYGIISSSIHNYRKRDAGNSAIQTKDVRIDWYKQTVELSYLYLLEKCKKEFPEILKNIEYYVAYDYQWRLQFDFLGNTIFSKEEKDHYIQNTITILEAIEDEILLEQLYMPSTIYQIYALKLKYGSYDRAMKAFFEKEKHPTISIQRTGISNNHLLLEFSLEYVYSNKPTLFYKAVGEMEYHEIQVMENKYEYYENITSDSITSCYAKLELPLREQRIQFYVEYSSDRKLLELNFGIWSNLTNHKRSYHNYKKYTIRKNLHELIIKRRNIFSTLKCEFLYQASLLTHSRFKNSLLRLGHFAIKPFIRKKIWIVTDRENGAGDNGEALFQYLSTVNNKRIKVYFAIHKNSKDINRLKQYGKVIYFHTYFYNLIYSHCSMLISSHADSYVYNPLGKSGCYMRDLYHYQYVFLQHGIIKHDLSSWLNRLERKFSLFITSTDKECDSIISNPKYGYGKDIVKVTGLARYDYLKNNTTSQKTIMLAPTWRRYLVGKTIGGTQQRRYNGEFKKSIFCKFYNELLNDEELIDILKKYNYKIRFCLHPSLKSQLQDFTFNESYIDIIIDPKYNEEFENNQLLITDYSSVAFDFAYLEKPVIFNTFDEEEFYSQHICKKGDLDMSKDGLGVEVKNVEDLKKEIIKYLKNDCKIEKKYLDRIHKFFKYHDQNNCQRIYEEILRLDEKDV